MATAVAWVLAVREEATGRRRLRRLETGAQDGGVCDGGRRDGGERWAACGGVMRAASVAEAALVPRSMERA